MRVTWNGIVLAIVFVALAQTVSALGISYPYMENNTLALSPGENHYFKLVIQNDEDVPVTVNITLNSPIASLVGGGLVTVPSKSYDAFVYLNITVPQDAQVGDRYSIAYVVGPGPERGEGQVPFSIRYTRSFDVLVTAGPVPVTESPNDTSNALGIKQGIGTAVIFGALTGLLCGLLVVFIWRRSSIAAKQIGDKGDTAIQNTRDDAVATGTAVPLAEEGQDTLPATNEIPTIPAMPTTTSDPPMNTSPVTLRPARPGHEFRLADGQIIATVAALSECLHSMSDDVFGHHVTANKNDFCTWIADELGAPDIAMRAQAAKSPHELRQVLEHAHD